METFFDLVISNLYEDICHRDLLERELPRARTLDIICPFISKEGANWLLKTSSNAAIEIITELSPRGVVSGVQSPEALELLMAAGCKISYFTSNLHAKFYWIDKKRALITSANLTSNGLSENFELGVALDPTELDSLRKRQRDRGLAEHLAAIWNFAKKSAEPVTDDVIEYFKRLKDRSQELMKELRALESELGEDLPRAQYVRFQKTCPNKQNIVTDIGRTTMFEGFDRSDWAVFRHNLELTPENLTSFRHILDQSIDPVLRRFYLQLRNEPLFKEGLPLLQAGVSKHVQLRTRFPESRYMYLTKPREGKRANKHIGEPSFILGMGVDAKGSWLEVRTGVEEDFLTELTPAGENLLKNMLTNIDEVTAKLRSLGAGWKLSHGSQSRGLQQVEDLESIESGHLSRIIRRHLESRELADFHIRKKYYLENSVDSAVVLSSKITSKVAENFLSLSFFFNLAHSGLQRE